MLIEIKKELAGLLRTAIDNLGLHSGAAPLPAVTMETQANPEFGDFSSPVALQLAKLLQAKPREVAAKIVAALAPHNDVAKVEIAGAGFINFTLKDTFWGRGVSQIDVQGDNYGASDHGQRQKVQVEFVSANPTGPLHIGHGRSAAYGDSLARVMSLAGYDVQKEYYINDAGRQMGLLGKTLHARYLQELGQEAAIPEDGYKGDYMIEIARELKREAADKYQAEPAAARFFTDYAIQKILADIQCDLERFHVTFDNWFSEKRELHDTGKLQAGLDFLRDRGYIYEKDGAVWLKTGNWEELDRVVVNSQGVPTYLAGDIAYHKNKYERGLQLIIDIWGHDHHGYQPRMKAVAEALGYSPDSLHLIVYQLVTLVRDGVPVKMSTRSGEFVTLKEVLDEVGVDAVRYFFNMRSPDSQLDFDLELAKKQSSDNPVYYVQYAYARICSISRNLGEYGLEEEKIAGADVELLIAAAEKNLIKKLAVFPELVIKCAVSFEPHHLTTYLQELAATFHNYYKHNRIMDRENIALSYARLKLLRALKIVFHNGLELLGVSTPERM